ncbi:hypothetical protein OIV83_004050 [Microbotryomycetes sp. JL201]|nr:hypothetical protein OIV83_004050 [Microbotryomycetes sp. JL201]
MPRPMDLRVQINRPNMDCASAPSMPSPSLKTPDMMQRSPLLGASAFSTPPCTPPILQNGFAPPPLNGNGACYGPRRGLLRRNSSLSSVSSSVAGDEDHDDSQVWTEEEKRVLKEMFDEFVMSNPARAPFNEAGPPPSNLTHSVAKAVIKTGPARMTRSATKALARENAMVRDEDDSMQGDGGKWRHGLKSTRLKLLQIVKEQQSEVEATPKQHDTPKRGPLARQGSMDFLPIARNIGKVAKLGSRLQRAEQGPPPVMARTHSSGPRPRVDRTLSLSTIIGSPSQPAKQPASSTAMARTSSESTHYQALSFGDELVSRMSETGLLDSSPNSPRRSLEASPDVPALEMIKRHPKAAKRDLSGLGSAFASPALGSYPTPDSSERKKKAKFTHHSPTNSLDLGRPPNTLASGIELQTEAKLAAAGATLGASASFYMTESLSNNSISSVDTVDSSASFFPGGKHARFGSLSSIASGDGVDDEPRRVPSPTAATFDLKRLSLHGLDEQDSREHHVKTAPVVHEPEDYFSAGREAQELREKFGSFTWQR